MGLRFPHAPKGLGMASGGKRLFFLPCIMGRSRTLKAGAEGRWGGRV